MRRIVSLMVKQLAVKCWDMGSNPILFFFRLIGISYYDKGGTVYEEEIVTKSKGFKGMEFE